MAEYSQHPEFFFADGSLAIRIELTVFKVHASVLARHSEVFRDMSGMPQPADCELVEGIPVVQLHDDVQDFTETLKAIYDCFHFDEINGTSSLGDLLSFLSGILRVSTKYDMVNLRKKCILLLEAKFPSTLTGCLALLKSQFKYEPSDIVRLITLAASTNIPSVLPWAYYLCTHMSVDDILHNPVLTWEHKALCLAGKERLWQAQISHSHSMLFRYSPSPQCTTNCQGKLSLLSISPAAPSSSSSSSSSSSLSSSSNVVAPKFGMTWRDSEELRQSPHPLEEYDDWGAWKLHVCSRCLSHLVTVHTEGRQRVWKELPTYFALGSWEDIHREQTS